MFSRLIAPKDTLTSTTDESLDEEVVEDLSVGKRDLLSSNNGVHYVDDMIPFHLTVVYGLLGRCIETFLRFGHLGFCRLILFFKFVIDVSKAL